MSMYSFDEMLQRVDLQRLRSYIIYGSEEYDSDDMRHYETRLLNDQSAIESRLEMIYPDGPERDNALDDLHKALGTYQNVFMEVGILAGARLVHQLLKDTPLEWGRG